MSIAARSERQTVAAARRIERRAAELLGAIAPAEERSLLAIADGLRSCAAALLDDARGASGQAGLANEALVLAAELRRHAGLRQARRRRDLDEAVRRLAQAPTLPALVDRLCAEASAGCGLRRVLASRVRDGVWSPWRLHEGEGEPHRMEGTAMALERLPLEAAIVASAAPETVLDARADPRVHQPLRRLLQSDAFVVAPVVVGPRVIALLYGDRPTEARGVDDEDRDLLWFFARSAGRLVERADVRDRLAAQRRLVRKTAAAVDALGAPVRPEIDLRQLVGRTAPRDTDERSMTVAGRSDLEESLSRRERDVLFLVVNGRDNAAIAEQLAISRSTVKSHVRSIMRKVGAGSRTQVIQRYHGPTPQRLE